MVHTMECFLTKFTPLFTPNSGSLSTVVGYQRVILWRGQDLFSPYKQSLHFENQESVVYGSSQANNSQEVNAMIGGFFFIAIFLSIIFMVGAVSVIYINKSQKIMKFVNALSSCKRLVWIKNKSSKLLTSKS